MKKLFLAVMLTLTATTASAINVPLYTIDDYRTKVIAMKKEYAEVDKIVTEHVQQDKIHDYELKIIELGVGDRCPDFTVDEMRNFGIRMLREEGSEYRVYQIKYPNEGKSKNHSIEYMEFVTEGYFDVIRYPFLILKKKNKKNSDEKREWIEWADVAIKRKHLREKIDFL